MSKSSQPAFQFPTAAIEVERAVSELRYGRPVVISEGDRKIAAFALDCVAPSLFDQFASVTENRHGLLLTARLLATSLAVSTTATTSLL